MRSISEASIHIFCQKSELQTLSTADNKDGSYRPEPYQGDIFHSGRNFR